MCVAGCNRLSFWIGRDDRDSATAVLNNENAGRGWFLRVDGEFSAKTLPVPLAPEGRILAS